MLEDDLPDRADRPGRYNLVDRGEGMLYGYGRHDHSIFVVDTRTREAWQLVSDDGRITRWETSCLSTGAMEGLTGVAKLNAEKMLAPYGFCVNEYRDGVAIVSWTLRPDGMYWADSGGFGGNSDMEIEFYAYIDRQGRIIIPFQNLEYEKMNKLRPLALDIYSICLG